MTKIFKKIFPPAQYFFDQHSYFLPDEMHSEMLMLLVFVYVKLLWEMQWTFIIRIQSNCSFRMYRAIFWRRRRRKFFLPPIDGGIAPIKFSKGGETKELRGIFRRRRRRKSSLTVETSEIKFWSNFDAF